MKKILVLSDTHGNISALEKLSNIMAESDMIFHLGDYQKDILLFKEFQDKIYSVKGNCDGGGIDQIVQVEDLKILLTHGDRYGVKNGLYNLFLKAKELDVNVVFYGHTHDANIVNEQGIYLINPGALKGFFQKSYCYAVVYGDKITAKIVDVR